MTPWIVACQAPLSMAFSGQEAWSELPFPTPGDLPDLGLNSCLLHWQVNSVPLAPLGFLIQSVSLCEWWLGARPSFSSQFHHYWLCSWLWGKHLMSLSQRLSSAHITGLLRAMNASVAAGLAVGRRGGVVKSVSIVCSYLITEV